MLFIVKNILCAAQIWLFEVAFKFDKRVYFRHTNISKNMKKERKSLTRNVKIKTFGQFLSRLLHTIRYDQHIT